jgi:peptidoglycan/LPS O-acetylase OafA/YrhL
LAVEEQFYLLYPVLLLVGLRLALPARYLFAISLTAIFLVLFERSMLWTGIESYDRVVMGLDTRADALLAGCSVAFALAGNLLPRGFFAIWFFRFLALGSAAFVSYLVIMGVKNEPYYNDGLASLTAICVGLVIFEMAGPNPMKTTRRILGVRPLAWTGRISYGLYLWHIPVFYFLGTPSNWSGAQIQTARFLTVFAVAALSYYSIELPFLKLKQRFSISRLVHETRSNDQIHEGVLITTSPAAL